MIFFYYYYLIIFIFREDLLLCDSMMWGFDGICNLCSEWAGSATLQN